MKKDKNCLGCLYFEYTEINYSICQDCKDMNCYEIEDVDEFEDVDEDVNLDED